MIQIDRHGSIRNFLHNIPLLISFCAFACLTIHSIGTIMTAVMGILILSAASFYIRTKRGYIRSVASPVTMTLVTILLMAMGCNFYRHMIDYSGMQQIADLIGISSRVIVCLMMGTGMIAAIYFCLWMAGIVQSGQGETRLKAVTDSNIANNAAAVLAGLGMVLSVVCSFNGYIWADEAYSLRIVQYSYKEIIAMCAADVHPPFYYMALKFAEDLGAMFFDGYYATVVIGKLFSVLAYILLTLLCWHKFRDEQPIRPFVLLCLYGMPQLLPYAIEIRMYSWALLFVTASFLYARDIIRRNAAKRTWILLTVFSVLSAYAHTFALIAMASVWLYLLIWIILYHRQELKKWFCYGCMVGLLFFPWLMILLRQVGYVTESYWIEPITWSMIPYFALFMLSGTLLPVPVLLLAGIVRKLKTANERASLFESAFGALIPLTTIFIGVAASIIIRPVFVARYMIPGLMCLWIAVVMTSKKCNRKIQVILSLLLLLSSVSSFASVTRAEAISKKQAESNITLVGSFEENAIVIISCNTHAADVVASYTDHMVYNWRGPELTAATTQYRKAYKNEDIFDDISQVSKWLNDGIPLYYVETVEAKEDERLPVRKDEWNLVRLGEHRFEKKTVVYKIVSVSDALLNVPQ